MHRIRHFGFLLAIAAFIVPAGQAQAGLILSADPLTLTTTGPGATGRLAVTISSTDGTDLLDFFGVEFRLTSSNGHYVSFVDPPSDTQLGNPSYLFHNDSAAEMVGPPSGAVSTNTNFNDTYIGGDGTLSGLGVVVPTLDPTNPKLLVSLEITTLNGSGVQAGDVFYLSLIQGPSTFFNGPIPSTGGDPPALGVDPSADVPIRVQVVVPEPGSIVSMSLGLLACSGYLWAGKRSRARIEVQSEFND